MQIIQRIKEWYNSISSNEAYTAGKNRIAQCDWRVVGRVAARDRKTALGLVCPAEEYIELLKQGSFHLVDFMQGMRDGLEERLKLEYN